MRHPRKHISRQREEPAPLASSGPDALAIAIEHNDWERAALLLMLGVSMAARSLPEGDIADLLAMLDQEEGR